MSQGLYQLPNYTSLNLSMVHMIKLRPGKGLLLINSYNKPIDIVDEDEDDVSVAFKVEIEKQMASGRKWTQSNWKAIREAVIANRTQQAAA
ncbi:hypothetical protein KAK06_22970 [Ideonella sp. 4Y11]|uniref:Uncharacterized protein n=1 Tax=Ideonella aquatica TaxID=2824119 RepID=A0A940YKA7_9BURK|nr:hypothetical protein [Ideonella aquatica]MBQ0961818.1 hypothetical protein [Ideonella aquatica]